MLKDDAPHRDAPPSLVRLAARRKTVSDVLLEHLEIFLTNGGLFLPQTLREGPVAALLNLPSDTPGQTRDPLPSPGVA